MTTTESRREASCSFPAEPGRGQARRAITGDAGAVLKSEQNSTRGVAGPAEGVELTRPEIVAVPVRSLLPGDSQRLAGEDKAHIALLAEIDTPLPPILVDRRTMRVIDGIHRLTAAAQKRQETVDVEFFDGSPDDAFLRGVEANVAHGLPLSRADRQAAAARIIASHSHLSDRSIGKSVGLAARTVPAIRRSTDELPQLNARLGRDGRSGRWTGRRAACGPPRCWLSIRAPLREVARGTGVSSATARDVRKRLERGEEPGPTRPGPAGTG